MNIAGFVRRGAAIGAALLTLAVSAGCGGKSSTASTVPSFLNRAYVRFVNGAPNITKVDVEINGSLKYAAVAYGVATDYLSLPVGTYSVVMYTAGNDSGVPIYSGSSSGALGSYTTIALAGTSNLTFYSVSDQTFHGTYDNAGAVNFINLSSSSGAAGASFGYYLNPLAAPNSPTLTPLAGSVLAGTESNPVAIPISATPFGLGAEAVGSSNAYATLLPSTVDPAQCASNSFSCNSGLLSVFLLDGPKMVGQFNQSGQ